MIFNNYAAPLNQFRHAEPILKGHNNKPHHKKHEAKVHAHHKKHAVSPHAHHKPAPKPQPQKKPVVKPIAQQQPIYARYAPLFAQFHKAAFPHLPPICKEQKQYGTWFRTSSPAELATRVCKLKKGGEAQRLMALTEFLLKKKPTDGNLKKLISHLVPRLNQFGLKNGDAVRRGKIKALYTIYMQPPPKPDYFENLKTCHIQKSHMQYHFKKALETIVKPVPAGVSLITCMNTVLNYILPTWPNTLKIHDDAVGERTKPELVQKIRNGIDNINNLYFAPYDRMRNMYGHIFFNISERIKKAPSMTKKERDDFNRQVRTFIQSLGITFCHCSARLNTDSNRYYFRFVENKISSADDTTSFEDTIHQELVKLRRSVFENSYFSVKTDQHDAATEQYMNHIFNGPLGLHLPDNFQPIWNDFAVTKRAPEIEKNFYASYTPLRIAHQLNNLIRTTKNGISPWFTRTQNFLESKHVGLKWDELFDLDETTYTLKGLKPAGMKLLLSDLKII